MNTFTVTMLMFASIAVGLPSYLMMTNEYSIDRVNDCSGPCYEAWKEETGGILQYERDKAAALAAASPADLGEALYKGCVACHGGRGEGGIGPALAGQSAAAVSEMLWQYKNGEQRGPQSNLMWGNAAMLSSADIDNISAYVETL